MDGFGFIHEKLDIKVLILFVLNRLPEPVDGAGLMELVMVDSGIGYFDYCECLAELEDTGHIALESDGYRITEKGSADGSAVESGIPYSVRLKAESKARAAAADMKRAHMIAAGHEETRDGEVLVSLSLSDGMGEIAQLKLLAANTEQAGRMEHSFRLYAEDAYKRIMEMLLDYPSSG